MFVFYKLNWDILNLKRVLQGFQGVFKGYTGINEE